MAQFVVDLGAGSGVESGSAGAQSHTIKLRGKLVADGKLTFGVALSGRLAR